MTACAAKEQSGEKISQKINLVFEKGIEIVENKEILSEEKTEEECERIFISDKNFIELRYGRMDLPESVLGDQYMIDRYKMIIWAKPKEESLEEQVDCVYGVLNKLREYELFNELLKDSCYIRLQKEPIDAFNNQHMEFQNKINRMLNL